MIEIIEAKTERLILRQWHNDDLPIFANLNADLVVMEYYTNVPTTEQSNQMAQRFQSLISERGWGFWAIEVIETKKFIGFVGLHHPAPELPFSPCVEIGWRLAKEFWGFGYATEAGTAALKVAFERLDLKEVFSFTSVINKKSQAVMQRLNMLNTNENFEYPSIPVGHPLREHVLYKITKERWLKYCE